VYKQIKSGYNSYLATKGTSNGAIGSFKMAANILKKMIRINNASTTKQDGG
jgi:hypothetical protein